MKIKQAELDGVYIIDNFVHKDERGVFVKVFSNETFLKEGIEFLPKEIYYSISHKNVVRGMHFQKPPMDHSKLVYVIKGRILDVVLDIRRSSQTYGQWFSVELSENERSIFIPSGFAHGFQSLEDDTTVVYQLNTVYSPTHDSGIRWDSFGYQWDIDIPIISERDKGFEVFYKMRDFF